MDFYDAHVHYLSSGSLMEHDAGWVHARNRGLKGIAAIIIGYHPGDRSHCLSLIPTSYHDKIDPSCFDRPLNPDSRIPDDFLGIPLFPYLDTRYIEEKNADLRPFRDAGFRGLKVLYVPEEDLEYGLDGWGKLFGRSMRASEELTVRLVEQAADFQWPVIFHVDLRRYSPFAEDLMKTFPGIPFIIPHFGFSRKAVQRVLSRFEHVRTDFSSLLPFMEREPEQYADFIGANSERVLFGSDSCLGWTEQLLGYLDFVEQKLKSEEVRSLVLRENYLRIHGNAE